MGNVNTRSLSSFFLYINLLYVQTFRAKLQKNSLTFDKLRRDGFIAMKFKTFRVHCLGDVFAAIRAGESQPEIAMSHCKVFTPELNQ